MTKGDISKKPQHKLEQACHKKTENGHRSYVVTAYHSDEEGTLIPNIPTQGPCSSWEGGACRLGLHHKRSRKTGPCFPLWVMRCRTHQHAFTLYPLGHGPYSRQPLVVCSPDGERPQQEQGRERFEGSIFDAALDGARGKAWPHSSNENSLSSRFITQVRHLQRVASILGIDPKSSKKEREEIGEILGICGQTHAEGAKVLSERSGYRAQSQAICRVLDGLEERRSLFERLAECTSRAKLWPECHVWTSKRLLKMPFRKLGT